MQSSAPYLEGDGYYTQGDIKTSENESEINMVNIDNKEIKDEESLREQLHKTEEEIVTLRQVLNVKLKLAQDLKRQLGITAINEMKDDLMHSINTIKESNTYKATTVAMKNVREKTTNSLSNASCRFSQKLGMLRNTNTFKSIEGKMGTAYSTVKKVPCKYNPGDKIFAKVKGFVYWPARVNPLPGDIVIPPNKIPIFFYGTHEVFFIAQTSCWPYDEKNKSKWGKPRPRAHFNEGMDEIENNSTIYQYGVDPKAEDFLAQFYEFKKMNGQNSIPNKSNNVSNDIEEEQSKDNLKSKGRKSISKKRNKSGSSASTKENKNNIKVDEMNENISEIKLDIDIERIDNRSSDTQSTRKRQHSESALSLKESNESEIHNTDEIVAENLDTSIRKRRKSDSTEENKPAIIAKSTKLRSVSKRKQKSMILNSSKKEVIETNFESEKIKMENEVKLETKNEITVNVIDVKIDNMSDENSLKSNNSDDDDIAKPATRCRTKSSSTTVASNKPRQKSYDSDSESPSVDSDNLKDEDFKPASKGKRMSKKPKPTPKAEKPEKKQKKPASTKKSVSKPKSKPSLSKKKPTPKVDESDDSLSSISSIEDWGSKIEKENKDYEEKMKLMETQRLQQEENAIKEASRKLKEKRHSESFSANESKEENVITVSGEEQKPVELEKEPICQIVKEVVVNIVKTDVSEVSNTCDVELEKKEIVPKNEEKEEIKPPANKVNKKNGSKKLVNSIESDKESIELVLENLKPGKVISKEVKTPKSLSSINKKSVKPLTNNRKRNRKLSTSSHSSSSPVVSTSESDTEVAKHDYKPKPAKKPRLTEKNSNSDDNSKPEQKFVDKTSLSPSNLDLIQILHNYNSDIRSSLILGHEDYKTCLERFRSLCQMKITLQQLVRVWQLMDTIKKCRRYKRNEQIKQEAQSVYKRFMDIYSQASKEEISQSQALLVQYRHQNNIQNQHVGNDSSKSNGGPSIPISVADMFQNKPPGHSVIPASIIDNNQKPKSTSAPVTNRQSENDKSRVTEEEINEEKMRLLSADLEAKVCDILNKIEKNVELNPINQKSLSHLLPVQTEGFIPIPTQWKPVSDSNNDDNNDGDAGADDDDDDDDVDAIVRRIEEVDIKLPVQTETHLADTINNHHNNFLNTVGGSTSALDERIENLINNSFISTSKDNRSHRKNHSRAASSSVSTGSKHHKKNSNSSPRAVSKTHSKLDQNQSVLSDEPNVRSSPIGSVPAVSIASAVIDQLEDNQEQQKDDIEIYDLLGV